MYLNGRTSLNGSRSCSAVSRISLVTYEHNLQSNVSHEHFSMNEFSTLPWTPVMTRWFDSYLRESNASSTTARTRLASRLCMFPAANYTMWWVFMICMLGVCVSERYNQMLFASIRRIMPWRGIDQSLVTAFINLVIQLKRWWHISKLEYTQTLKRVVIQSVIWYCNQSFVHNSRPSQNLQLDRCFIKHTPPGVLPAHTKHAVLVDECFKVPNGFKCEVLHAQTPNRCVTINAFDGWHIFDSCKLQPAPQYSNTICKFRGKPSIEPFLFVAKTGDQSYQRKKKQVL